jgi:hypothetical protein
MDSQTNGAHGGLRLQPQAIPELKQAYLQALSQLEGVLADAGRADAGGGFRIQRPAMMDDASTGFQAAFNGYVEDGPGSVRQQVTAFRHRLHDAIDKLDDIARAYDRNETGTAAVLSRQLEP